MVGITLLFVGKGAYYLSSSVPMLLSSFGIPTNTIQVVNMGPQVDIDFYRLFWYLYGHLFFRDETSVAPNWALNLAYKMEEILDISPTRPM
jgi:hypothetical protein